jgi:hypothetical protein
MSERFKPIPRNIVNGSETLSAYSRNGSIVRGADIEEVVILRSAAIAANQNYEIDFQKIGYPVRLESVWIDIPSNQATSLTILAKENNQTIYTFNLNQSQIPYTFPYLVLKPEIKLIITPNQSVGSITIFCKQVIILEEPNV